MILKTINNKKKIALKMGVLSKMFKDSSGRKFAKYGGSKRKKINGVKLRTMLWRVTTGDDSVQKLDDILRKDILGCALTFPSTAKGLLNDNTTTHLMTFAFMNGYKAIVVINTQVDFEKQLHALMQKTSNVLICTEKKSQKKYICDNISKHNNEHKFFVLYNESYTKLTLFPNKKKYEETKLVNIDLENLSKYSNTKSLKFDDQLNKLIPIPPSSKIVKDPTRSEMFELGRVRQRSNSW